MPIDPHAYDDADEAPEAAGGRRFADFDCPSCNANNPSYEPFGEGDEVMCSYCGQSYAVRLTPTGRLRLEEI